MTRFTLGVNKLRTARYKRRAMVIISDGGDNRSRYTLKEVKSVLAESDVLTYSIGIFDDVPIPLFKSIEERWGRKWLDEVTVSAADATFPPTIGARFPRSPPSSAVRCAINTSSDTVPPIPTTTANGARFR